MLHLFIKQRRTNKNLQTNCKQKCYRISSTHIDLEMFYGYRNVPLGIPTTYGFQGYVQLRKEFSTSNTKNFYNFLFV